MLVHAREPVRQNLPNLWMGVGADDHLGDFLFSRTCGNDSQ